MKITLEFLLCFLVNKPRLSQMRKLTQDPRQPTEHLGSAAPSDSENLNPWTPNKQRRVL